MCTFDSDLDLPKAARNVKKAPITMFLKPNNPKEFYRFRLLKFHRSDLNDRTSPFIERHIHDHWGVNDKGVKLPDDTVVCLSTKHVKYNGNKFKDCPMCQHAGENYKIWKDSGYKDPISGGKFNTMKRKSQYVIPVYVVNDPNNAKNNGNLKCFFFTEKKDYDAFLKVVDDEIIKAKLSAKAGKPYTIWNNKNAVDFCLRMEVVAVTVHPGEQNEYIFNKREITKMKFLPEAYDIPELTKEKVDAFEFDEQYYTSNTVDEIREFYQKYYSCGSVNTPKDDASFFDDDDDVVQIPTVSVSNESTSNTSDDMNDDKVNEMFDDASDDTNEKDIFDDDMSTSHMDGSESTEPIETKEKVKQNLDEILGDMDFD